MPGRARRVSIVVMREKCPLCGRSQAGRNCPVLRQRICSLCCGRGRGRTIQCEAECRFFKMGQHRALLRFVSLVRDIAPEDDWYVVLHNIWLAMVRMRQGRVPELSDADCREAASNVADTLRTRSKGLIYEYRSQNPRVQLVADELTSVVFSHEAGRGGYRKVGTEELGRCLRYVVRQIEEAEKQSISFLDLAAQTVTGEYLADDRSLLV